MPKLFPQIAHDTITPALMQSPFLDVEWHFGIQLRELIRLANTSESTVPKGMSFPEFQEARRAARSKLAAEIQESLGHEFDARDEIDCRLEYVECTTPDEIDSERIVACYREVASYVSTSARTQPKSLHADASLITSLLTPILKWQGDPSLRACASDLIAEMESALESVGDILESPAYSANLLEFQNGLIFSYMVIAEATEIGLSAVVLSRHLRVHRNVSSASWTDTPSRIRAQYAALLLRFILRFYQPDEPFETKSGFSLNVLADMRSMFADAAESLGDAPLTSHQWVFRWFKDKLDAEVFSSFRAAALPADLSVLSDTEQAIAVEIAKRIGSYRSGVTINHLERFLVQFGTTRRIRGALRMLDHLKFYPTWDLAAAIETQLESELHRASPSHKLVIAPFGEHTGSTAIINYLASHSKLTDRLDFASDLTVALARTNPGDCLYFVDDCLLSGTQTLNILGDLMGTRVRKSHHTIHCTELSDEAKRQLTERRLRFVFCVVTDVGVERFNQHIGATGVGAAEPKLLYSALEHGSSKAFEPLGPIPWESIDERDELKEFCSDVGYGILERRASAKQWDDVRRKESALGFSDFQRVLVFPYNVPKTTLTLLWERGTSKTPWQPLFPGFD